jgi:hypothetical protein
MKKEIHSVTLTTDFRGIPFISGLMVKSPKTYSSLINFFTEEYNNLSPEEVFMFNDDIDFEFEPFKTYCANFYISSEPDEYGCEYETIAYISKIWEVDRI